MHEWSADCVLPHSEWWSRLFFYSLLITESSVRSVSVERISFMIWSIILHWLKWANDLTLVFHEGLWNWTEKSWRWWMTKLFLTLKEAACLRLNICSFPRTRWPSSSLQTLEPQAASDLGHMSPRTPQMTYLYRLSSLLIPAKMTLGAAHH